MKVFEIMASQNSPLFDKNAFSQILVFDGNIATELYERGFYINRPFEELSLTAPGEVRQVHEDFLRAGCDILTTNTFNVNRFQLRVFDIEDKQFEILKSSLEICHEACKTTSRRAVIALSLGPTGQLIEPLGPLAKEDVRKEFAEILRLAQRAGSFDFVLLDLFSNVSELECAIDGLRRVDPNIPVLASLSSRQDQEALLKEFAKTIGARTDVDALGLNGVDGPSEVFTLLKKLEWLTSKPIVARPNAGIPKHVNGRYFYLTSPDYLAKYAKRYIEVGATGVGGACGATPVHIAAIARAVKMQKAQVRATVLQEAQQSNGSHQILQRRSLNERTDSLVGQKLREKKHVVSLEVMAPKGVDVNLFFKQLREVEAAGISFVNVPDGARASTRVSSLHVAAAVAHQNFKLRVIPHFTTRDRNLIALQSDLLGAYINGVRDLLLVTGDPPKLGNTKDATGVYDIDSIGLTHMVDSLNQGFSPSGDALGSATSFGIGVASNPTAINLDLELSRWNYKVEMGADFAVTQPIFDADSFLRWKDKIGKNYRPQLVGIWPLISLRNAEFMANEVPGVRVPEWVLSEMAKSQDNKEDAIKRGVEISSKVIERLAAEAEGFVISAPLGKVPVAMTLFEQVKGLLRS